MQKKRTAGLLFWQISNWGSRIFIKIFFSERKRRILWRNIETKTLPCACRNIEGGPIINYYYYIIHTLANIKQHIVSKNILTGDLKRVVYQFPVRLQKLPAFGVLTGFGLIYYYKSLNLLGKKDQTLLGIVGSKFRPSSSCPVWGFSPTSGLLGGLGQYISSL